MKIFITGSSGFIGQNFISMFHQSFDEMYLLTRTESLIKSGKLFSKYKNVTLIEGNIEEDEVCVHENQRKLLIKNVDTVFHLAGGYQINMDFDQAYLQNVIGTQNILNLCKDIHKLKYFHYTSSYGVNGNSSQLFFENDLMEDGKFGDNYIRSKMLAEALVRKADIGKVKKRIYRPGVVVGGSNGDKISKIDGPYYYFNFLNKFKNFKKIISRVKIIPFSFHKKANLPIIPVDVLCEWMMIAIKNPKAKAKLRCYHFLYEKNINLESFLNEVTKEFGFDMKLLQIYKSKKLFKKALPFIGFPKEVSEYFFSHANYDVGNRKTDFPEFKENIKKDLIKKLVIGYKKYSKEVRA